MLKVKTILKQSEIHGIGLFADEFIPKGTLIFEEDEFTVKFNNEEVQNFTEKKVEFIKKYCYLRDDVWYCSMDNDRFTNHSNIPNTYETETFTFAAKDIQPGEEITTNYQSICDKYEEKFTKQ